MMFNRGQTVVCINNSPGFGASWMKCPLSLRHTYTVLDILDDGHVRVDGDPRCYWSETRFRPAVERKTDISIFTAMLNPSKQKARAHD